MSTILIVEDEEKNMKLVRDILQHRGHTVLEAGNGEDGVRLAAEHRPDLILMDIHLPGFDGIEALRRIRAEPGLGAVPVLSVSASVMPQDRHHLVTSGFDAFISKPISLVPFVTMVEHFLTNGRAR
jgi:two-component system cell cycle response regulator DivK